MTKIGRNDPCPCGSGKKYKKCCGENETESSTGDEQKPFGHDGSSAFHFPVANRNLWVNKDEEEEVEEYDDDEEDDEEETLPELSAEDALVVEEWWKDFLASESLDDMLEHLEAIVHSHPHLIDYLDLGEESIEINILSFGDVYLDDGDEDDFISFLLHLKEELPIIYDLGGACYDAYVIPWLIANERKDEVKDYLRNFVIENNTYTHDVDWLISLLLATDTTDDAKLLIMSINVTDVDYRNALDLFLLHHLPSNYMDLDDDGRIQVAVNFHKETGIPYDETRAAYWATKLEGMSRPFTPWSDVPGKEETLEEDVAITSHFAKFLHDKLKISWYSAQYYADHIEDYLNCCHASLEEPAPRLFDFPSKASIKENVHRVSSHLVDDPESTATFEETDALHLMVTLNTVYYFADYLKACGNFSEDEAKTIQKHCIALHDEMYVKVKYEGYEMLCFEKFPVF